MIQLIQPLANTIVITALGGAAVVVALTVVKIVVSFAALRSSKPDADVVSKKACAYCGPLLGEETQCPYCGAVRQDTKT